jgi:hypothetical protein
MIMDDDKSLTAEYESCMFPVLTAGTPTGFYGLQSGYNAAVEGDTIFADNSVFDGDFSVNASKSVFFEGGFDCVFDSAVGGTTIDGDMFVSGGKFTVDYGMLQVGLWVVTNDSCNDCHGQTQGPYRQITGPGGDFVKTSHHVSDGTSNEIVTNEDCIVCHAELSNDGLHANGYIELKDADDYVPASGGSGPLGIFTLGDGQGQPGTGSWSDDRDLTLFCLSCHDGDGASATFRPGGTALNPFNDWLANSHESGFLENPGPHSRLRVVDIYSLLDSLLTASHHNVLDYKYSVWEDGVDIEGIDDRAFTGTALINGDASEGSLLECADCHTTAENAHGAVNSRYFLKDKDGNDALGAGNTVICFRCHSESVYYDGDDAGFSIFPVHQGQLGNHDQDNDNIFGIGCLNCHGGNNFGAIHGALEDEEINNEGSGPYYTPYRFINGASFGYISNWDQQFDVSCGAKETTTFFSNCTNHSRDGGGQSYDRNYLRDLEY